MDWRLYLAWIAITSCVTFLVYGFDKSQAKKGGQRVPEFTLHVLALAGGFPGGWLGRLVFRHKTQKWFFTFVLATSFLIHLGLVYWLFFM
jgi:uncharacterized membrane protein YsdA (DUF1294 family)